MNYKNSIYKPDIRETEFGKFHALIRFGDSPKKHFIGAFDSYRLALSAYNKVLNDPKSRKTFHTKELERKKAYQEELKIMEYFWTNDDNRDKTMARVFNRRLDTISAIINKHLDIHFDRIKAKTMDVEFVEYKNNL